MITKNRAKILFATMTYHGGRWWVSLNIEAADLHPARQHPTRGATDAGGWVGVDRGLSAFLVAATAEGREVARFTDAPKALARNLTRQRRLAKSLSRKQKGSTHRHQIADKLARHHCHVANIRRHFLHQVSNALVKTHDRLVIEDLNVSGMLANRRLARAISDAGWAEFARLLGYKQAWRRGQILSADRWYPSSRLCPHCGAIRTDLDVGRPGFRLRLRASLRSRHQRCNQSSALGPNPLQSITRSPDPPSNGAGLTMPADGTALTSTQRVPVKPARMKREPTFTPRPRPEPRTSEKGGAEHTQCSTRFKAGSSRRSHRRPATLPRWSQKRTPTRDRSPCWRFRAVR